MLKAWMKSWWVGGGAGGVDDKPVGGCEEVLVAWMKSWWVGGSACGVDEELEGGRM